MDENLLPSSSDNAANAAGAADQAVSESMDILQQTSSLLERIHAQREREEAAKKAKATTTTATSNKASSATTTTTTTASSSTNASVSTSIIEQQQQQQQIAATTTTTTTGEGQQQQQQQTSSTTENNDTTITTDSNTSNNGGGNINATISSDDDHDVERNNMNNSNNNNNTMNHTTTNFDNNNNGGGGGSGSSGLQVPNYSPIADDAIFSGGTGTTTTRRDMTNSGFGFSMNFDNIIPRSFATTTTNSSSNGYNHLSTNEHNYDQSSEALLSENVASLSNQYSMSAYFRMMILDIYSIFRSMPVPIQIITVLVLFWIMWKLI